MRDPGRGVLSPHVKNINIHKLPLINHIRQGSCTGLTRCTTVITNIAIAKCIGLLRQGGASSIVVTIHGQVFFSDRKSVAGWATSPRLIHSTHALLSNSRQVFPFCQLIAGLVCHNIALLWDCKHVASKNNMPKYS